MNTDLRLESLIAAVGNTRADAVMTRYMGHNPIREGREYDAHEKAKTALKTYIEKNYERRQA